MTDLRPEAKAPVWESRRRLELYGRGFGKGGGTSGVQGRRYGPGKDDDLVGVCVCVCVCVNL